MAFQGIEWDIYIYFTRMAGPKEDRKVNIPLKYKDKYIFYKKKQYTH